MQRPYILFVFALLAPALLMATEQSGSVRAADQFIPGAAVTATLGETKITVFTNEAGRYRLDLSPGLWEMQVQMFGFNPVQKVVSVGTEPSRVDWTMEMPRPGEAPVEPLSSVGESKAVVLTPVVPPTTTAATPTAPSTTATTPAQTATSTPATPTTQPPAGRGNANGRGQQGGGRGQQAGGRGRGGQAGNTQQARAGFQGATVAATAEGQQAIAAAAGGNVPDLGGVEAENAFLIEGTISGGLGASVDDEQRRQQQLNQFGGGRGGFPGGNQPGFPSLDGGDSIGLGGLGASAIDAGFGGGAGGGPGFGDGGGGGRGGRGGPGGGGGRGGGPGGPGGGPGGGGGGRGGGRGGNNGGGRGGRGGNFNTFGNNRRNQPRYNGSVQVQLTNSTFNAAPYSLNGQSSVKPSSNRETFNANLSGPLVIPKLLNLPRSQFTLTYQGGLGNTGGNPTGSVPTQDMLGGNFSQSLRGDPITIYDPLSGQPFFNNQIPLNRFSDAAKGLLQYIPPATYPGLIQNYRLITSNPSHNNNIGIRFNLPLTNKDRLNFNVQTQRQYSQNEQTFGFLDTTNGNGLSAQTGWSHSFAPRFNNSANVTLSRNLNTSTPFFAFTSNVAGNLGITGTSQDPVNFGPPSLSFTNFTGLSDGSATVTRNQTLGFTDQVTYVFKRVHNLQFGVGYQRQQQNNQTNQNARGSFSFNGSATSLLDANGRPVAGTGYDFADFLLGLPTTTSIRFPTNDYFRGWSTNFFAQDDYRVNRSLSLNIGLRYDFFAPFTEKYGQIANIDVDPYFTQATVVTPGQSTQLSGALPNSLVHSDPNNFSPRLGFAYRPSQKDSTVFRGGYSLTYRGSTYAQMVAQMGGQPPFVRTANLTSSAATLLTLTDGFPVLPNQLANTYGVNPNFKLGYDTTWDLTIQHNLPSALLLELEYTGNKGTNLPVTEPLTPANGVTIPNFNGFNYLTFGANSIYHGGVTRLTRRFNQGMSFVFSYTYSKSIDDAGNGSSIQFIRNWNLERALSSSDQRHRLTLTYQLSSPVGVRGMLRNGGWKEHALAGWTLNGTVTAASGTPLTPTLGGNLANTGGLGALGGSSRAEATGLPVESDGSNPYFNLAAFTTPPAGQFGNAGRNTIPGPFQTAFNAQLNRSFRLGEGRKQLQFNLSATNALNHIVITRFGTQVGSANYGLPTGTSSPRSVQLRMRFNF